MVATSAFPTLVVIALGIVVGAVPNAITHGIGSADGRRLIATLVIAAIVVHEARVHEISARGLAILLPMLAVTASAGSISFDDITLAWALAGLPDADRLERDLTPDGPALTGSRPPGDLPQRRVALEGVRFRYPAGSADVLAGVDLELRAGESTALVGVNGAGKSTLVSLLARLRDPTAGRITVDDVDVRELDPERWQRTVALMPQEPVRYGLSGHLAAEHRRLTAEVDRRSGREASRVLVVQAAGWLLYAAGLMSAIAFVAIRASAGAISIGTVLMTVSLIRRSRNQLSSAAAGSGALVNTLATADRLFWLEDHAAAQAALAGTAEPPVTLHNGITLRHVSFGYPGTQRPVLSDLNVTLAAGSTVALVGENGSGKTTLVKLLLGMYQPDEGEILVDGTPLTALDPAAWRSGARPRSRTTPASTPPRSNRSGWPTCRGWPTSPPP